MIAGILLLAFMAAGEGITILSVRPLIDVVLNPQSTAQQLPLFTIPWGGPTIDLNIFVPSRIHHVWSVFAIAILILFLAKGLAEFVGITIDSICRVGQHHGFAKQGVQPSRATADWVLSRQPRRPRDVRGDQRH